MNDGSQQLANKKPERTPRSIELVAQCDGCVDQLHALVEDLERKAYYIIGPELPQEPETTEAKLDPEQTRISADVFCLYDRMQVFRNRLSNIVERIES